MKRISRDEIRDNLLLGGTVPLEPVWVSEDDEPYTRCLACGRHIFPTVDDPWCSPHCHASYIDELDGSGR